MPFHGQTILPAVRRIKDYERLLGLPYEYIVLLDCHISQLKPLVDMARNAGKRALLHADLIEGLKNDEYAAEFLCQIVRPAGLISTRAAVIAKAKQNGLLSVQRMFLLDSNALEKSIRLVEKTKPDYVEVLPGLLPHMIREVMERTGTPVFAGGLIRSADEVERAVAAGAAAVTTSNTALWRQFQHHGG